MKKDAHTELETKLSELASGGVLTSHEKASVRNALIFHMHQTTIETPSVVSPYYTWFVRSPVVAAAMIVLFAGGGTVAAGTQADPGDFLYTFKIHVLEPTQASLIVSDAHRTAFEIERVDRRLHEYATIAQQDSTTEHEQLLAESLSESIARVTQTAESLATQDDTELAFSTNAELLAVLQAHAVVLDAVDPDVTVTEVEHVVEGGIAETENSDYLLRASLKSGGVTASQLERRSEVVRAARDFMIEQSENESLSSVDRVAVERALALVHEIIADAEMARAAGDLSSAYLLYIEADQRLTELETTVAADDSFGIGIHLTDAAPTSDVHEE